MKNEEKVVTNQTIIDEGTPDMPKNIIEAWPKWEKKIVNLTGDEYSGKTHLSNIFKKKVTNPKKNINPIINALVSVIL